MKRDGSIERALEIAAHHHKGQVDKQGAPYILHPLRVAATVGRDLSTVIVAILHDIIEDTEIEAKDLRIEGFKRDVVDAILLLSRPPKGAPDRPTYAEFIQSIDEAEGLPGAIAKVVKIADLYDNMDRLGSLPPEERTIGKRYRKAIKVLTGEEYQ